MRKMGFLAALACALALSVPTVRAEHKYEQYQQGEQMSFTYSKNRFVCSTLETVSTVVTVIRENFDPQQQVSLFWAPIVERDGSTVFREAITDKVPKGIRRAVQGECHRAPDTLTILRPHGYIVIDEKNELVITELADEDGDRFFTWFLNIHVVRAERGSDEEARYRRIMRKR